MKLLSLFSGIGAFEKALTNIGVDYELVGFSEVDKWAIESYCAIHEVDRELNLGDVSKIKNEDLPDNIDMVTYGFPCQDISIAGNQEGIKKGTRSGLLYEAERIIEHTKPKYAIAENVKNLISKRHKGDFDKLLERLDSYGYNNYWKVLNAKDYGVPQNRERVFIISIRKDVDGGNFDFDKVETRPNTLLLKDILQEGYPDDYVITKDNGFRECIEKNFKESEASFDKMIKVGNIYPSGGQNGNIYSYLGISPTLRSGQGVKGSGIGSNNAPKIIDCNMVIRKTTPLENWKIMGFKEGDFTLAKGEGVSDTQLYKQAGNSIVVPVLEGIFKVLLDIK